MPRIGAYFAEEVRQYIEKSEKFGVENLYNRGLKVHTTLDVRLQQLELAHHDRRLRVDDRTEVAAERGVLVAPQRAGDEEYGNQHGAGEVVGRQRFRVFKFKPANATGETP